jgi:hypothetical protein
MVYTERQLDLIRLHLLLQNNITLNRIQNKVFYMHLLIINMLRVNTEIKTPSDGEIER